MTSNAKILEIAHLMLNVDANGSHADRNRFEQELQRLGQADIMMALLVRKLLEGKRYFIATDNPETVRRSRGIAQQIGATVEEEKGLDCTKMLFSPPDGPRH
jgi:hypothetical protein